MTMSPPPPAVVIKPWPIAANAALLGGIVAAALVVVNSALVDADPRLVGTAVFIDLSVTIAIVHYFVGVRRGRLPALTLVPVTAGGLLLAHAIVPSAAQPESSLPLVIAAVLEAGVLVLALIRIKRLVRGYWTARKSGGNRFEAIERGFIAVVPSVPAVALFVRLEAELWTFALTGLFRRAPREHPLTHHKKPQWVAIAFTLLFLSLIEGSLIHLLLVNNGYDTAAWVSLALHAYGLVWVMGDAQALRLRPSQQVDVNGTAHVQLNVGVRASARFALHDVSSVTVLPTTELANGANLEAHQARASVFGAPNLRIDLSAPATFRSVLRAPREVTTLFVQVDDASAWIRALGPDAN